MGQRKHYAVAMMDDESVEGLLRTAFSKQYDRDAACLHRKHGVSCIACRQKRWKNIIHLYYRDGYTIYQVADMIGVTRTNAMSTLRSIQRVAQGLSASRGLPRKDRGRPRGASPLSGQRRKRCLDAVWPLFDPRRIFIT